ncbi:LysR family transcriptional regulator [Amylibacter ulvae]|uniref:LysR family transcriptional regulator n=1 Tax=Paramylibacter ulvae TaxID=1651968 RepID=A0ABQ3CUB8_9RHOB|nr:LysR family transcriptional regulator [Amylibacter ulvae]GHA44292.1 LysR family transcriptional regulator [Amylibacter ulvae]
MNGARVNDILIFLSVADARNFVEGGKIHGLTRSTAGKAIARLENNYGVRLFNRTTRAVSLTEEGQKLYQHGLAIRSAMDTADQTMTEKLGVPSGTLRITAPDALGRKLLMPIIRTYLQTWPEMRLDVSFSDAVSPIIEDGFDLALRFGVTNPDQSLISRKIFTDTPALCASPDYLSKHGALTRIEHLSKHDLLQFASGGERQPWELQDNSEFWTNAPGRVRLRFDSAAALHEAALCGMGVALLPKILLKDDLASGRLIMVLPNVVHDEVPLAALYPHKKYLEPKVRSFIDMVVSELN